VRFGLIGLGRMGRSLGELALHSGHEPVSWDPSDEARRVAVDRGIDTRASLDELVGSLSAPRLLLMYVPHHAVDANVEALVELLEEGDIVADGGNSHWEPSEARRVRLGEVGIRLLDVGTSGGIADALGWEGAAFMVSGDRDAFRTAEPVLRSMAVDDDAVHYVGEGSAGHFVKLVHNAIEFGMLQAIAEGYELLVRSEHDIDIAALFEHWNHGTVIRSWLIELMANALREGGVGPEAGVPPDLDALGTYVEDTGEVKWVLEWALERDVPTPVASAAQQMLMAYRERDWPAAKAVALLRNQFGGHPLRRTEPAREEDDRSG
jgi:6-phosphogluconate dehydrogenase